MIKRQVDRVKTKVLDQAHVVFGYDRRKNQGKTKRQFLESMFLEQAVSQDRELVMTLFTQVLRRLHDLHKSCGYEAVLDMLFEEGGKPKTPSLPSQP